MKDDNELKNFEKIGLIAGYDINVIGKFGAKKNKKFVDIIKKDEHIQEEVIKYTEQPNSMIFAITKKSVIKGLYIFITEKNDGVRNLKEVKEVFTDEITDEIKDKYDKVIVNEAKDYIALGEFDKVTTKDLVVEKTDDKSAGVSGYLLSFGFSIFMFLFWYIILDDWLMGIMWAVILGGTGITTTNIKVSKKRGRKKKD